MSLIINGIDMPKRDEEYKIIIRHNGQAIVDKRTYFEEAEAVQLPKGYEGIVDALDAVTWYNGLAEVILSWKDLEPQDYSHISCPDNYGYKIAGLLSPGEKEFIGQLQVMWMICVILFGDYGSSPRYGWIEKENLEEFHKFIDAITETQREADHDDLDEGDAGQV